MPWAVLVIGATILVTAFQGTEYQFYMQVRNDIFGGGNGVKNGFFFWLVAIAIVGGLGYIPGFKPLSNAFLILLLVVLFLAQSKNGAGGFFTQFQSQLQNINSTPANPAGITVPTTNVSGILGPLPMVPPIQG